MKVLVDLVDSTGTQSLKKKSFLEIHPNQSLWMIKTFIFHIFQVPPAKQQLFLKIIDQDNPKEKSKTYLKVLHSYRNVKDYPITENSEIQVQVFDKELPSEYIIPPKKTNSLSESTWGEQTLPITTTTTTISHKDRNMTLGREKSSTKVHVLSSKKGTCPALCFAVGKGLYRGITGKKYEIKLYRVDAKGVMVNLTSPNFQIEIFKIKSELEDRKMPFTYEQRKSEYSLLTIAPMTYGDYSINIRIDDLPICGSPFLCTVIDEMNPSLKELAFSNEWIEEIVELITMMASQDSSIDNLFSIGVEGLLNLVFYPDSNIQLQMTSVLAKLLNKDKNKERFIREGGIGIFFKIVSLDNWATFPELRRFIASCLCILSGSRSFISRFFSECGIELIILLSKSESIDCQRMISIFISQVSESYEFQVHLSTDSVKELLNQYLSSKDNITVNSALKSISNLSTSFDQKLESNKKILSSLLDCCKSIVSVSKKALIFKSFSNFVQNEILCNYLISNGLLELIIPSKSSSLLNNSSNYLELPMFYQWELNVNSIFCNTESNPIKYNQSFQQIFKDETDYVFFISLTISNMLAHTNSLKIHEYFCNGNGLLLLKQNILCHDCSARAESFRSFMIITNSPHEVCKKTLIQNNIINYLVSTLFDSSQVESSFIIQTISNLCEYDPACVNSIGLDGIDKFIVLLKSLDSLAIPISLILANISRNDKYKNRIITGGGKLFLQNLIDLVRQGKVSVLRPIFPSDVVMMEEVGKGVSGVVWKGTWEGNIVAIKTFNEEGLSFNEREFLSEATIMSVLRHENIVHCIGGSRSQGRMFLVSDFFVRGSLYKIIHANDIPLSNAKIIHIALQAAYGMQYLHSLGIIHRDLKSGNLLIDKDWNVRIADFGVSRVVDNRRMTKAVGTPCYMAVEVLIGKTEYSQQADVYSFGFVLWEMISRQIPYHDLKQIDWIRMVLETSYRPPIPDSCLIDIKQLIEICWDSEPERRPTFAQIIKILESIKDSMLKKGFFEEFSKPQNIRAKSLTSTNYSIDDSIISYDSINENTITSIDPTIHQTEVLKNLINEEDFKYDDEGDTTEEDMSDDEEKKVETFGSFSEKSLSPPPFRKWETATPDKPQNNNPKRLSTFRFQTSINQDIKLNDNNDSVSASSSISSSLPSVSSLPSSPQNDIINNNLINNLTNNLTNNNSNENNIENDNSNFIEPQSNTTTPNNTPVLSPPLPLVKSTISPSTSDNDFISSSVSSNGGSIPSSLASNSSIYSIPSGTSPLLPIPNSNFTSPSPIPSSGGSARSNNSVPSSMESTPPTSLPSSPSSFSPLVFKPFIKPQQQQSHSISPPIAKNRSLNTFNTTINVGELTKKFDTQFDPTSSSPTTKQSIKK